MPKRSENIKRNIGACFSERSCEGRSLACHVIAIIIVEDCMYLEIFKGNDYNCHYGAQHTWSHRDDLNIRFRFVPDCMAARSQRGCCIIHRGWLYPLLSSLSLSTIIIIIIHRGWLYPLLSSSLQYTHGRHYPPPRPHHLHHNILSQSSKSTKTRHTFLQTPFSLSLSSLHRIRQRKVKFSWSQPPLRYFVLFYCQASTLLVLL